MGRLVRDPEIRYSQTNNGNLAIARYTLAVDRRFKREGDQQTADFISCVAFGKQGEFAEKYLHQGIKIVVEGRIQTGSYTDKETGKKVYTTDIVVENTEFAESKSATQNNGASGVSQVNSNPASSIGDGFMQIPDGLDDDGLPFN